jgi:hypothetical protein
VAETVLAPSLWRDGWPKPASAESSIERVSVTSGLRLSIDSPAHVRFWRASGEFSSEVSAAGRRAPTWAGMEMNAAITSTVTGMTAGSCQSGGFAVSSPLTAETSARPPGGPRRLRPRRWGAMIARVWRRTAAAADGDACARYPEDGVADYCATLGNWGCPSLAARGLRPSTDARVSRLTEPDDVAPGVDEHKLGSGDGLQVKVQLGPRQETRFLVGEFRALEPSRGDGRLQHESSDTLGVKRGEMRSGRAPGHHGARWALDRQPIARAAMSAPNSPLLQNLPPRSS